MAVQRLSLGIRGRRSVALLGSLVFAFSLLAFPFGTFSSFFISPFLLVSASAGVSKCVLLFEGCILGLQREINRGRHDVSCSVTRRFSCHLEVGQVVQDILHN